MQNSANSALQRPPYNLATYFDNDGNNDDTTTTTTAAAAASTTINNKTTITLIIHKVMLSAIIPVKL